MDGQRENTVVASGVGQAGAVPDAADLHLSVDVVEESPATAYAAVEAAVSRVVAALDDGGVAARERQTHRITLQPHYDHHDPDPRSARPRLAGYRATVAVRVRLSDLPGVPQVLETVIGAGGETLTVGGFDLVTSDPRPARASAEVAAIADATERAERLATAAGATLGAVVAIRHDRPSGGGSARALGWHSESAGRSVEPGEETFAAHVTVEFLLSS